MEQTTVKNEYRTGDTQPPKSHRGLIAFLLVTVILLCGIISALSMMNIRLWQQLQEQEEGSIDFSKPAQVATVDTGFRYGFSGRSVDKFWQSYSQLPAGVYITEVEPASAAYAAGLRAGDVVLCVDQNKVYTMQAVESCLHNKSGAVTVQLLRDDHLMVLNLHLTEE